MSTTASSRRAETANAFLERRENLARDHARLFEGGIERGEVCDPPPEVVRCGRGGGGGGTKFMSSAGGETRGLPIIESLVRDVMRNMVPGSAVSLLNACTPGVVEKG